jgi:hypothetical protein
MLIRLGGRDSGIQTGSSPQLKNQERLASSPVRHLPTFFARRFVELIFEVFWSIDHSVTPTSEEDTSTFRYLVQSMAYVFFPCDCNAPHDFLNCVFSVTNMHSDIVSIFE